jgi:hypothetical protein
MPPNKRKRKDLTKDQIKTVVSFLTDNSKVKDGKRVPNFGAFAAAAKKVDPPVNSTIISRIWKRASKNRHDGSKQAYRATPEKVGKCGRKEKYDRYQLMADMLEIPIEKRQSYSALAAELRVPQTTLHRIVTKEKDVIVPHTNAIKPLLTEENMMTRVYYCWDHIDRPFQGQVTAQANFLYDDFYKTIHLDEKWFFISQEKFRYYLVHGEKPPVRKVKHKSHILKIMFLAAVARPRFNAAGECTFDGKIGIWPFVKQVAAQRTSVNRPAGTLETKSVSVTGAVYLDYVINKVLPAIKQKWPDARERKLTLQHDNAKSHFSENQPEWRAAASYGSWDFRLTPQPANSPDTNILDLGFFRALQSEQWRDGFETTADGLIAQVRRAWDRFDPEKIDANFITLQSCLGEILLDQGGNIYDIPHVGKERMRRRDGRLPAALPVSEEAKTMLQDLGFLEPGGNT